jgi:GTP-binding protein Era
MRCGTVAIIGRTNVGKSTFLNACVGEKIAIVSPLPQTTRDELLGVVHRPDFQIAFTDTPGFHRPKSELGRRMNQRALDTLRSHDVVLFMTEVAKLGSLPKKAWRPDFDPIQEDDRRLLTLLPEETPVVLVLNKVDALSDKGRLLPLIDAFSKVRSFAAIIPTSVMTEDGVERVLAELEALLPEKEQPSYADDVLTDKPAIFFVREYVREQIMLSTQREVPHAVAVTVERFEEDDKLARVYATIHVEKPGQRVILVGHRGEQIKSIGIGARQRLEQLLGKQVHLELFVRVTERWKDVPRQLRELGYESSGGRSLSNLLPRTEQREPKRKAAPKKDNKKDSKKLAKRGGKKLAKRAVQTLAKRGGKKLAKKPSAGRPGAPRKKAARAPSRGAA